MRSGFGTSSGARMRMATNKADMTRQWPTPVTVKEVKSFMLFLQFNAVFLATEKGEKMYTHLTDSLQDVARKKTIHRTQEMDNKLTKLKKQLSSDCNFNPVGTQAMVSQLYMLELGENWRPFKHTARAWT